MLAASAILVPAASLPTVLPLIFPLWLNLRVKSFLVTALAVGFMFLTSLVLWAVAA
jgi:hypothetical protein